MLMIMGIEMNVNPIYAKTAYFDIVCFPGDGTILSSRQDNDRYSARMAGPLISEEVQSRPYQERHQP